MNKLSEILRIVSEDNREIYLKPPSEIRENLLKDLSLSFSSLSSLFMDFADQWYNSKSKGQDAIQTSDNLEERIDIKLFQNEKLDFTKLKKTMIRMNRIDDALGGLDRVSYLLKYYEDACRQRSLEKYALLSETFRVYSIDMMRESIRNEARRLENQIERCNLYYQSKLNSKTLNTAYVALAVSVLSFILAISSALKLI
jgi:hypothetical protein